MSNHGRIAGQLEFSAKLKQAAIDNPDLPVRFIVNAFASMAESRESTTPFVSRTARILHRFSPE
jgi:hypothetical protein